MRLTGEIRSAGYPVVIVMLLVAVYCLLAGSDWAAGTLALLGIVLLGLVTRTGTGPGRRAPG